MQALILLCGIFLLGCLSFEMISKEMEGISGRIVCKVPIRLPEIEVSIPNPHFNWKTLNQESWIDFFVL